MLQHYFQKALGFLPFLASHRSADSLEAWKNTLTPCKSTHAFRSLKISYFQGELTSHSRHASDSWHGKTTMDLRRMMQQQMWTLNPSTLQELTFCMAQGRSMTFILTRAGARDGIPVYRLDAHQAAQAKHLGVTRKYPSLYDDATAPAKDDLLIDGQLYAPETAEYDFRFIE